MDYGFDPLMHEYPSRRYPVYAGGGMVNCSSPQAAAAGLEALRMGGNAMDAAVAAAAALTVTEPTANGLGSDAFAIIWSQSDKKLYGLNSSGRAPQLASIERVERDGLMRDGVMPKHGWAPVTVPGAVGAWVKVSERFGRLTLSQALSPAVRYAAEGYPCSPNLAASWKRAYEVYKNSLTAPCFKAWFDTFAPLDRGYEAGETVRLPDHAATLDDIGRTNGESFYKGEIARRIDEESRRFGGYLRYEDLASHEALWVEPISVDYRGWQVFELPPNGQGIAALMALNIMKEFDFASMPANEACHRSIEAMKMAFADAFRTVTDPDHMTVDPKELLLPEYGAARARQMGDRARVWTDRTPHRSGTVYLCCADGEGNMVSFIQSNYMGFGSGVVVGGTGIALQNRGADFSLDPNDINCLMPGKRSYHTIIPGFLMKDGLPVGPFGVMGAYMQPQGHVQVVSNFVDRRMNPQQALDAPRWQWMRDGRVTVEQGFDKDILAALISRGHDIAVSANTPSFGRGQMIVRLGNGTLVGGTESRTDSSIACF